MSLVGKSGGKKYHQRTIEISTSEYDEQRLIIEGCLTDDRFQEFIMATGEKKSPGNLHKMIIRLIVSKANMEIEDLRVEMPFVPGEGCLETVNSIASVRGLRIAHGFTSKIKTLAGKGKGCQHLVELLTSMAPSAIQGCVAYNSQKTPEYLSKKMDAIIDTCWRWRADGPLVKSIREKLHLPEIGAMNCKKAT